MFNDTMFNETYCWDFTMSDGNTEPGFRPLGGPSNRATKTANKAATFCSK
jgi:hypothetical protein